MAPAGTLLEQYVRGWPWPPADHRRVLSCPLTRAPTQCGP